jgi:acetyltransferase-like isoleucine patch superfamily enzyme
MSNPAHHTLEDPFSLVPRILTRLRTQWMLWTYPFLSIGRDFSAHSSCDLRRAIAPYIKIGDSVWLDRDVWLNIPFKPKDGTPVILFDDGCRIGRRCMISAQNRIHVGRNTIFAPSVLLMDHNHEFKNTTISISDQGTTAGGTIRVEEGCWLGYGAVILCNDGELVIGKNSVIGANAVVSRSIPPFSVVAGNPGRVVRHYDPSKGVWVLGT